MEKILLGVLKSSHSIKLKKVLLDKFISDSESATSTAQQQLSVDFSLIEFIRELESIWNIGNVALIGRKGDYESLSSHYDLVRSVLKRLFVHQEKLNAAYLVEQRSEQIGEFGELVSHVSNSIKATFAVKTSKSLKCIKRAMLTLLLWLRLLIDSFNISVTSIETRINLINLLTVLNSCVKESTSTFNFLYFVQSDSAFSRDYLLVYKCILPLVDDCYQIYYSCAGDDADAETSSNSNAAKRALDEAAQFNADVNLLRIKQFIEDCLLEIINLLMQSASFTQNPKAIPVEEEDSIASRCDSSKNIVDSGNEDSENKPQATLKESLENFCELCKFINALTCKSTRLYEASFNYVLSILAKCEPDEENDYRPIQITCAELFKAYNFNDTKAILIRRLQVINFNHFSLEC
jgi:hypothetical protein